MAIVGSRRNQMAIAQKLLQNIATLNELIEMEWDDVASNPLREEERKNICLQIVNCQAELQNLLRAIERQSKLGHYLTAVRLKPIWPRATCCDLDMFWQF